MLRSQKHILFLASWYPNRDAPALGNFIQRHAQAAALHHNISVVYAIAEKEMEEGQTELQETHSGLLSEYIVYYGKIKSTVPVISSLKKLDAYRTAMRLAVDAAVQRSGAPALLHLNVIWPAALATLPLLREFKAPLLISEHWSGYLPEDGNYKGNTLKSISKKIAAKAKHITVVSQKMQQAMQAHGLGKTFSLLPNTVDTTLFKPAENNSRDKSNIRLLHVSMLVDREKNISGLLRVMKKLEAHPQLTLHIIGEGPEREQHEQLAASLGILNKSVFFMGFKNATEIATEMQASDALLMFSHFEGMPVSIIEAQCCGLPVIATRTGSIPEMLNAENGILVAPGDEAALEKAILQFAENKNRFVRETIACSAAQQYSMKAVGEKLDQLYRSILANV